MLACACGGLIEAAAVLTMIGLVAVASAVGSAVSWVYDKINGR